MVRGVSDEVIGEIRERYRLLAPEMNEQLRRRFAGAEADSLGWGGVAAVADATAMSRNTVKAGLREVQELRKLGQAPDSKNASNRVRQLGGGRKSSTERDPGLLIALDALLEPVTRGDPESPLRWTSKSVRKLAAELSSGGHQVSRQKVCELLHEGGYSLQGTRKTREGGTHPDRDEQFKYISSQAIEFQHRGQPVISMDTKKKELVGDFKNAGREWRPKGTPEDVRVYDFVDPELGKAIPYGIYDIFRNEGWVSVGVDHDTPEFAVASIRRWWLEMGSLAYPNASELLITADGGGSNGSRPRMWKTALQDFAEETGLRISVSHFPPGTSKWNKIEHRLFCHITQNWRGRPLISHEVIVNLIANTTTTNGLKVHAELDENEYAKGRTVPDKEFSELRIKRATFHGEWNYSLHPPCDHVIS